MSDQTPIVPGRDDKNETDEPGVITKARARFAAMRSDEDVRKTLRNGALFVGGMAVDAPITLGITAYRLTDAARKRLNEDKQKVK